MAKVLIVVDYQNDFVDNDNGTLGFKRAMEIEESIYKRIKEYVDRDDYIIFTLDTHRHNYLSTQEGKNLPIKHTIKGTWGHQLYGKVKEIVDELQSKESTSIRIIEKGTFPSDILIEELKYLDKLEQTITLGGNTRRRGITEIELCGVITDICVISNAVIAKAALPEAKIIINKSICGSTNTEMEEKAYDIMRNLQMEVIE